MILLFPTHPDYRKQDDETDVSKMFRRILKSLGVKTPSMDSLVHNLTTMVESGILEEMETAVEEPKVLSFHLHRQQRFMLETYKKYGHRLFTPDEVTLGLLNDLPEIEKRILRVTVRWMDQAIIGMQSNIWDADILWPNFDAAIRESMLYMSISKLYKPNYISAVYDEVAEYREIFHQIESKSQSHNHLRSLLILFPYLTERTLSDATVMNSLKLAAAQEKLMIDRFYFIHNPCPMVLLREMAKEDWPAVKHDRELKKIYIETFGMPEFYWNQADS